MKTDAARRDIPITPALHDALSAEKRRGDYIFHMRNGKPMTQSAFKSMWMNVSRRCVGEGRVKRELGERYGTVTVSLDFYVTPHQLRHTYVTRLFENGIDPKTIQHLVGHTDVALTLRVYTYYLQESRQAETAEKVSAALG